MTTNSFFLLPLRDGIEVLPAPPLPPSLIWVDLRGLFHHRTQCKRSSGTTKANSKGILAASTQDSWGLAFEAPARESLWRGPEMTSEEGGGQAEPTTQQFLPRSQASEWSSLGPSRWAWASAGHNRATPRGALGVNLSCWVMQELLLPQIMLYK